MNIVLFAHPAFTAHQSMPRFARMLADGMRARGHEVEVRAPQARFIRLPLPGALHKWLGYIDQYVVFPNEMRIRLRQYPADTLFVFADQALGPWVPLVADRPHVIHCHDFLAQRSALGEVPENPTSWMGQQYQAYIRRGYSQGHYFVSVSQTTRNDLHRFLPARPSHSEVVYNGLNQAFVPCDIAEARSRLGRNLGFDLASGDVLHVGGNQWYKNRVGVIELYDAWRASGGGGLPLLLIGEAASETLIKTWRNSAFNDDIKLLSGINDEIIRLAYAGATIFLYPSLAEGFGWPIAEAMAAGCPVLTTKEAPMTEVGATAAFYIPRRPTTGDARTWAEAGAQVVKQVVELDVIGRKAIVEAGLINADRFGAVTALNRIEAIYQSVLEIHKHASTA